MKLAADIVVRRDDEYLFIRRKNPPFEGELALPGGFVEENETVEAAAMRELKEETGISIDKCGFRLVGVFSEPKRDPRERIVSIAFRCVVMPDTEAHAADDAASLCWMNKDDAIAEGLAFDHRWILEVAG